MANVLQGELIFSQDTKQTIIYEAFNKASGGGLFVSIGSASNAKIGNAVKINIQPNGNGIKMAGDAVYFLADGYNIDVNYLFLGSENNNTNYQDIARLGLETNEKVVIQDGDAFMLSGLQILL